MCMTTEDGIDASNTAGHFQVNVHTVVRDNDYDLGAIFTGLTDFKDTDPGDLRNLAGFHGVTNIVGTGGLAFSTVFTLTPSNSAVSR